MSSERQPKYRQEIQQYLGLLVCTMWSRLLPLFDLETSSPGRSRFLGIVPKSIISGCLTQQQ
ncbi:hypothetical protein N7495_002343 [Penicillium taxi]|uniref:uncharacterized protein n=1 Tax=Penicillium taxi TaxID=168475 RepID=UPI002544FB86|nr:uncharacterized protein N7495_002343 [Penicillium taxi]KAJ5901815.1 hypothetical protein N7495_002343 [Penicillium taxi]